MSAEVAIRALKAIESLSNLMDLYDEFDQEEEQPKVKKRKIYVKSDDVEAQILKNITWKNSNDDETLCPLTKENFEELHSKLVSRFKRRRLIYSHISVRMRLALTLRYLVAGDAHTALEKVSHISRKCTVRIIPDMLQHMVEILQEDYLKLPPTEDAWQNVSNDFNTFWDFPHTLGIIDARKFLYRTLRNETSSLVLLSILDAHSRFQYIEIIENNIYENPTVYKNSRLYKSLRKNSLNLPPAKSLKEQTDKTPYFFVASDIFNMDRFILKNYDEDMKLSRAQQAFNFRINRAKIPSQMAFDIMFYKFKIFNKINDIKMKNVKLIIKTCCILHNYLIEKITKPMDYNENMQNLNLPRSTLRYISQQMSETYEKATEIRENVCNYCVNGGNIPEQWRKIIKTEVGGII